MDFTEILSGSLPLQGFDVGSIRNTIQLFVANFKTEMVRFMKLSFSGQPSK